MIHDNWFAYAIFWWAASGFIVSLIFWLEALIASGIAFLFRIITNQRSNRT